MGENSQYCEGSDDPLLPNSSQEELQGKTEKSAQINSVGKRKMLTGILVMLFCLSFSGPVLAAIDLSGQCEDMSKAPKISINELDPLAQAKQQVERIKLAQPVNEKDKTKYIRPTGGDCQNLELPERKSLDPADPFQKIEKSESLNPKDFQKNDTGLAENALSEKDKTDKDQERERAYQSLVSGHPIEAMVSFIAECDQETASFLIAIAKKESNWGIHSPKKDGRDCYNYWGYKGSYNQTKSGYSCFDSPEQAIEVVGGRIKKLIGQKIDTPGKMVVWKCGSSCAGHGSGDVQKWISDVSKYYALARS
jgi:flagellum-specific peptidoglycan hydrolase FlgJ